MFSSKKGREVSFIVILVAALLMASSFAMAEPSPGHDFTELDLGPLNINNGKLGIGIENPGEKLDVHSSSNGIFSISLSRSGVSDDHNTWKIWNMDGASYGNDFEIWQYPLDSNPSCCIRRFEIQDDGDIVLSPSGGNVGIGTSGPSAKLDVSGNMILSGGSRSISLPASGGYSLTVKA